MGILIILVHLLSCLVIAKSSQVMHHIPESRRARAQQMPRWHLSWGHSLKSSNCTCIISDDQRILSAVNSYYLSVPYWSWIIPTLIATMKMGGTRRERQNIRHCLEYAWFLPHPRRKNSHHFLLMLLKTTTNMR